jgi:hypothetical protein
MKRWFQAALIGAVLVSLMTVFVQYIGGGAITGTSCLLDNLLLACKFYAVPLLWIWVRKRGEQVKIGLLAFGITSIVSGAMLFGTVLVAARKVICVP